MAKENTIGMLHGDYVAAYNFLSRMLGAIDHRNRACTIGLSQSRECFIELFGALGNASMHLGIAAPSCQLMARS